MSSKLKVLAIIPFLAALWLLVSFFTDASHDGDNLDVLKQADQTTHTNEPENKHAQEEFKEAADQVDKNAHTTHTAPHKHDTDGTLAKFPENFDFEREATELNSLKADYPRSRGQLMDIVLSANVYANARAHSAAELAQRQKGALKVEALKALVQLEKDKEVSKRQLLVISEDSKDPVIRRIAKAALDSQAKGRPFFSDTVRALGNLPVPE